LNGARLTAKLDFLASYAAAGPNFLENVRLLSGIHPNAELGNVFAYDLVSMETRLPFKYLINVNEFSIVKRRNSDGQGTAREYL
jgi:hypothetical protein